MGGADDVGIRPMTAQDLAAVEQVSDDAFHELDRRTFPRAWPDPRRRTPEHSAAWIARTARTLATDAGGCWVAEYDGEVVGVATSMVRERLWLLSTYAVRPGMQGLGVGRPLLDRAVAHGAGCDRGMIAASEDARALRRYWRAGFRLHPQMLLQGRVDRGSIPRLTGLRDGSGADRGWMDDLDRTLRGGPHGPDHASLAERSRLVVADERSGYAYTTERSVLLLAARDEATAASLLWECLAGMPGEAEVAHVTTANPWAVDVAMQAGLAVVTRGHLALRGMEPPAPYLHNGGLL